MADQAWKKFTTAMSNKTTGKKTNKPNSGNATILKKGELVVQRLSSDVLKVCNTPFVDCI
jgi:hypothetical protein